MRGPQDDSHLLLEDLAPAHMQDSADDIARLRMALASASSCLADIVNEVMPSCRHQRAITYRRAPLNANLFL